MRSTLTLVFLCWLTDFVSSLLTRSADAPNWCAADWKCGHWKHLRCENKLKEKNKNCDKIRIEMSPEDRRDILHAHNWFRNYVASGSSHRGFLFDVGRKWGSLVANHSLPWNRQDINKWLKNLILWLDEDGQAADMRQLVWDYELEKSAAIWASQCSIKKHRPNHCAPTERHKDVHMNVDSGKESSLRPFSTTLSFLSFMKYPDNYFGGDRINLTRSYRPGMWDPFYALIYSPTYAIGCSKGLCYCRQGSPYPSGSFICLYGPSFDHTSSGYKIYEVDNGTCSRCPVGTACRPKATYKYLCARPDDPTVPLALYSPDEGLGNLHAPSIANHICVFVILMNIF